MSFKAVVVGLHASSLLIVAIMTICAVIARRTKQQSSRYELDGNLTTTEERCILEGCLCSPDIFLEAERIECLDRSSDQVQEDEYYYAICVWVHSDAPTAVVIDNIAGAHYTFSNQQTHDSVQDGVPDLFTQCTILDHHRSAVIISLLHETWSPPGTVVIESIVDVQCQATSEVQRIQHRFIPHHMQQQQRRLLKGVTVPPLTGASNESIGTAGDTHAHDTNADSKSSSGQSFLSWSCAVIVIVLLGIMIALCVLGSCGLVRLVDRLVLWRIRLIVQQDQDHELREFRRKYLPNLDETTTTGELIAWDGPFPPSPSGPAVSSSSSSSSSAALSSHDGGGRRGGGAGTASDHDQGSLAYSCSADGGSSFSSMDDSLKSAYSSRATAAGSSTERSDLLLDHEFARPSFSSSSTINTTVPMNSLLPGTIVS